MFEKINNHIFLKLCELLNVGWVEGDDVWFGNLYCHQQCACIIVKGCGGGMCYINARLS